jgi:hypothetical protein
MSLAKILEVDEYFRGQQGLEPSVRLLDLNSTNKTASEAEEWSRSITPVPGKTYILVLAMGSSEYYGPNRNGDAFEENELKQHHKTFETNAHVYKSHINKDPAKSYGRVVKSFYNDDMHRVELVLELDNNKAPDIVDKVNAGQSVAVSMGCKIKYDVCSICGNKAPTRADYCTHLKNELNKIYPDGRVVCAYNPKPNFFDISIVWRPADKTGYMLKKVANSREIGSSSAWLAEKIAARVTLARYLNKAAEIEKMVSGVGYKPTTEAGQEGSNSDSYLTKQWLTTVVPKLKSSYVEINDEDKEYLSSKNLPKVLATLSSMGIFLATPEFLDLIYIKATGSKAPEGLANNLVDLQGDIFNLVSKYPDMAEELIFNKVAPTGSEEVDSEVMDKVSKYIPLRSLNESWVLSRPSGFLKSASEDLCSSQYTLPRNSINIPYLDKVASISYATYVASILDSVESPAYSKFASLVSEQAEGSASRESRPWVPYTVLALNHM